MDGAKLTTDTSEILCKKYSGKQASLLRRSFFVRRDGAISFDDPGVSRIRSS